MQNPDANVSGPRSANGCSEGALCQLPRAAVSVFVNRTDGLFPIQDRLGEAHVYNLERSAMSYERLGLFSIAPVLAAALLTLLAGCAAQTGVVSLETRPGVTVDVTLDGPESATALLLFFEGGTGKLNISSRGFGAVSKTLFVENELKFALIDAPSDRAKFGGGMNPRFRGSRDHLADIDAVLAMLKKENPIPVWLVGISMGTRSVAHYAVKRHENIDGVVLMSSHTKPPRGRSIAEFGLERITVPLLVIAHRNDGCGRTPPVGAQKIADAATSSPNATAIYFTGGMNEGQYPCKPRTHHTFYGIEREVVLAISEFVRRNSK